jgi:pteridine reductase
MPKVALITGAARRIGAACARLLHGEGYNIALHYHASELEAMQLAAELERVRAESVNLLVADLLDFEQVTLLATAAAEHWGGIDVLINNASAFAPGAMGSVTEADWDRLLGSNLKAPFFLSQALMPTLSERQGCIVNIVDIHAEKGLSGYPVYSIAKAGLAAMTKCLAKELAPNIRVNAVAPGAILWPDNDLGDPQKAEILQKVALQRCGEVDDIAKAVRFLVADADYVTGHILTVDGGRMLFT